MTRKLAILIISLIMTILPSTLSAASAQRILSEISNLPGVESTYIGPAALRLAGSYIPLDDSMGGIANAIKSLKSIEVVECDNPKSFDKIRKFTDSLIDRLNLEVVIESTEDGETTRIFGLVPEGDGTQDGNTLEGLLIETLEKGEYNLVFVRGTIDLSKLELNNDNK